MLLPQAPSKVILGLTLLALFGYLDQAIWLRQPWDWSQLLRGLHHETLVGICVFIGIAFIFIRIIKTKRKR